MFTYFIIFPNNDLRKLSTTILQHWGRKKRRSGGRSALERASKAFTGETMLHFDASISEPVAQEDEEEYREKKYHLQRQR